MPTKQLKHNDASNAWHGRRRSLLASEEAHQQSQADFGAGRGPWKRESPPLAQILARGFGFQLIHR